MGSECRGGGANVKVPVASLPTGTFTLDPDSAFAAAG